LSNVTEIDPYNSNYLPFKVCTFFNQSNQSKFNSDTWSIATQETIQKYLQKYKREIKTITHIQIKSIVQSCCTKKYCTILLHDLWHWFANRTQWYGIQCSLLCREQQLKKYTSHAIAPCV